MSTINKKYIPSPITYSLTYHIKLQVWEMRVQSGDVEKYFWAFCFSGLHMSFISEGKCIHYEQKYILTWPITYIITYHIKLQVSEMRVQPRNVEKYF